MPYNELNVVSNDVYVAHRLQYDNGWMNGAIEGGIDNPEEELALVWDTLDSIQSVHPSERNTATCTDGRFRVRLDNDVRVVPVRPQLVGAQMVAGFRATEALGSAIYSDAVAEAPVDVRLLNSAGILISNGLRPSTHEACGGAKGFKTVIANEVAFLSTQYRNHVEATTTDTYYDSRIHTRVATEGFARLEAGYYTGYSDALVTKAVRQVSGQDAIEYYKNDGRGQHGHIEKIKVVLADEIDDAAISPNRIAEINGGQVFGQNGSAVHMLASVLSEAVRPGVSQEWAYLTARHAIESFSAAGHGTLAHGLGTWLVSRVA